ncbi:MAG: extracellular solute-binding protein [Eubacteriales bacterium]|nr:extracellular solute-binding protein [Eubacteriales bacterium]
MKKKLISVFMAAAVAVSAFAVPVAAEAEEQVTLTYWGWDSNYYEPLIEAYMESHPNVKIEATATEWGDMLTKVQQALASGSELPTIIPMDITLIGNWKKMGITENLLDYGLDTSVYNSALIEAATDADGNVIGLFENVCPAGIAYKRDLAKEYFGTDDPDELAEMFSSYDAYVEKGKEVAEKSDGSVFLFHSGQAVAEWLYFASDIANVSDDTINMTDKMTDVMSKLVELRDAGAVDSYQNGTAEANATYADDNHIFYPCPDWALTYYIESNDPDGSGNWGLIKAPSGYSHGGTAMGISSSASDEQKEAAYDFITWAVSSEEGATVAKDKAGYITQDSTIATDEFCKRSDEEFFGGQDISTLYYKDIASIISIATPSAFDNDIVSVRNDVAQQLMNDTSMTLEDAVSAAVEELGQLVTDETVTIK